MMSSQRPYTPAVSASTLNTSAIQFEPLQAELFSQIADDIAKTIADSQANKASQIRKFYDELCMWNERVQQAGYSRHASNPEAQQQQKDAKYRELEPFIKMLNAKVAYAKGRKHVDDNYEQLLRHCLGKVNNATSLKHCKLFMEAVMGFYKAHAPNSH